MARRIPPDAFDFYVGLGSDRSYQKVADEYGVSKRAVTKLAGREGWQRRLDDLERRSRERSDEKAVESLEAMGERHLRMLKLVQGRAIETLRSMPLTTAMEAVRALDMAIRQERLVRGQPSERTAVEIEDVIRRQVERWLPIEEEGDE